jgi:hypothetical protein
MHDEDHDGKFPDESPVQVRELAVLRDRGHWTAAAPRRTWWSSTPDPPRRCCAVTAPAPAAPAAPTEVNAPLKVGCLAASMAAGADSRWRRCDSLCNHNCLISYRASLAQSRR